MADLLDDLLALAVDAAGAAGKLLAERLHGARTEIGTKSSATDMVSEVDRASERLVIDRIHAARPDDAVLGEEGGHAAGTSGVRWVIDPLDGTTNYLYGYPLFGVSIAAEVDGSTAVGVVHDPSRGETFTAIRGRGSFLDGVRLEVGGPPTLATALVGTGFSYASERRAWQAAVLSHVLPATRDIRRSGAAAVDLCWVACRRLDVFYEFGLQPWDVAAGGLVAAEAGAVVGTVGGGPAPTDTTIAAAPNLAPALREMLADAQAAAPPLLD